MGIKTKRKAPSKGGRPSLYRPDFVEQTRKLCELGATERDLSEFFGVSHQTLLRWRLAHPEFCDALKAGKYSADDRVEMSLYHRATGYSFDTEKVFNYQGQIVRAKTVEHVPPDTTAMIFWLKNRRPVQWRDRQDDVRIDVHMSLADLVNASYRPDLPSLADVKLVEGSKTEPAK